jgi:hypothetical protein
LACKELAKITGTVPGRSVKNLPERVDELVRLGQSYYPGDDPGTWHDGKAEAIAFLEREGLHAGGLTQESLPDRIRKRRGGLAEFKPVVGDWVRDMAAKRGVGPVRAVAALFMACDAHGVDVDKMQRVRDAAKWYVSLPITNPQSFTTKTSKDVPGRDAAIGMIFNRVLEARTQLLDAKVADAVGA